jgi:hypothetical protein
MLPNFPQEFIFKLFPHFHNSRVPGKHPVSLPTVKMDAVVPPKCWCPPTSLHGATTHNKFDWATYKHILGKVLRLRERGLLTSGMWGRVVWHLGTDVSEQRTDSFFTALKVRCATKRRRRYCELKAGISLLPFQKTCRFWYFVQICKISRTSTRNFNLDTNWEWAGDV